MERKPLTILGYEITTQKFMGDSYDLDRCDFELVEYFFSIIIDEIPLRDRAFIKYNKMINLTSFRQSADANLYEGTFITARFGKEQDIIDIYNQIAAGKKPKDHGVRNEVNFMLDKRTGLFLIEKDSENVARGPFIQKFIRYHKDMIEDYLQAFNKKFDPVKMHRPNFLKISSLPSKTFFEEIREFSTIKDAYYYLDISELAPKSNEAANILYLHNRAEENGMKGVTKVKVSFENDIPKQSVEGVEGYFKKLFEEQHFEGIGVNGKLHSGRTKNIELENIQRAFDVKVKHNEDGTPSLQDLQDNMSNIFLKDNPIEYKKEIDQYEGVNTIGDEKEDREIQGGR